MYHHSKKNSQNIGTCTFRPMNPIGTIFTYMLIYVHHDCFNLFTYIIMFTYAYVYIYICICMNMFYIPILKSCLPIYLYVYHNEIRKGGPTPVISRVITPIIGLGLTNRWLVVFFPPLWPTLYGIWYITLFQPPSYAGLRRFQGTTQTSPGAIRRSLGCFLVVVFPWKANGGWL